jgi:CheY-like chemotaxis protein
MPAHILVIEDNAVSRELMVHMLEVADREALGAPDGEQGLALARSRRPDLVLCDIELPGIDGFEVLRRLRADPDTRNIPVLAVTSFSMLGNRERALAAGFDGFIAKPIIFSTFAEEIDSVIGAR